MILHVQQIFIRFQISITHDTKFLSLEFRKTISYNESPPLSEYVSYNNLKFIEIVSILNNQTAMILNNAII